jgi:hypothetical protein
MIDDKKSVGVLFRQVKEAHKNQLLSGYRFHESQHLSDNQSSTICLSLVFLDKTCGHKVGQVIEYIRNNFRVVRISYHDRKPMDPLGVTFTFSLVPVTELPNQSI